MVDLSAELLGHCLYHKVVDQNVDHDVKVSEMVYISISPMLFLNTEVCELYSC